MKIVTVTAENIQQLNQLDYDYLLLYVDDDLEITELLKHSKPRTILYFGKDKAKREQLHKAHHFEISEQQALSETLLQDFVASRLFRGQKTQLLSPNEWVFVDSGFSGSYTRKGRYEVDFEGDFGDSLTPAFIYTKHYESYWGRSGYTATGYFESGISYDVDVELTTSSAVDFQFTFTFFTKEGEVYEERFSERNFVLKIPEHVDAHSLQLTFSLKGRGMVTLGKLFFHQSRKGYGTFFAGDEVSPVENGEKIYHYFIPGKDQSRLIISFTGYLNQLPKFEYTTLSQHDYPVLLFSDFRSRGGAFQLGKGLDERYEMAVISIINQHLDELHLTGKDLIVNGYSMGSYPAMYYGVHFGAGDFIISKPLINIGTMTEKNELIWSPKWDGWFIAVRQFLMGRVLKKDTPILDALLWKKLNQASLEGSTMHLFTLNQDEYDGASLPQLLQFLSKKEVRVNHIAYDGLHVERSREMGEFIHEALDKIKGNLKEGSE